MDALGVVETAKDVAPAGTQISRVCVSSSEEWVYWKQQQEHGKRKHLPAAYGFWNKVQGLGLPLLAKTMQTKAWTGLI